ncbi:MAG TPA: universal stress protein, partial [Syntrophobacteraceae bacterium]|nr:universal stress protein [Syntrophobacteraceae bacterium]
DFALRSIIACLDSTPHSNPVLTACSELAVKFEAKLHLLYVVPTPESVTPEDVPGGRLAPRTTRLLLDLESEQTTERMRKQLQVLLSRNIEASGSVERGEVERAIVSAAAERQADIVALATRGLAGIGAFWANDLVSRICASCYKVLLLFPATEQK